MTEDAKKVIPVISNLGSLTIFSVVTELNRFYAHMSNSLNRDAESSVLTPEQKHISENTNPAALAAELKKSSASFTLETYSSLNPFKTETLSLSLEKDEIIKFSKKDTSILMYGAKDLNFNKGMPFEAVGNGKIKVSLTVSTQSPYEESVIAYTGIPKEVGRFLSRMGFNNVVNEYYEISKARIINEAKISGNPVSETKPERDKLSQEQKRITGLIERLEKDPKIISDVDVRSKKATGQHSTY